MADEPTNTIFPRRPASRRHTPHKCGHCSKEFFPKRVERNQFCSRACVARQKSLESAESREQIRARTALRRAGEKAERHAAREAAKDAKAEALKLRLVRVCQDCSVEVTKYRRRCDACSTIASAASKLASRRKHRPIRKAIGRARKFGCEYEAVNPRKVFERDGWRCQMCWKKTPEKLRGSFHADAPELDHIIPLSKGGPHSYLNTQCACRSCNGSKGAAIIGQMRMFA